METVGTQAIFLAAIWGISSSGTMYACSKQSAPASIVQRRKSYWALNWLGWTVMNRS